MYFHAISLKDVIFPNHLIIKRNGIIFERFKSDVDTKQANETAWGK